MANNVIGSLIVNLGLETGRLNSDTTKAANHFNSFENKAKRSLGNIKTSVAGLMGSMGLLTGAAGALSVAGLGVMTKSAIDSADNIGKLSDRLGASTEALSQYQYVAELSGVTFETLTMGWQRMTRRVAEAAQGTGEAKNALIELNLSAVDLNRLKPEQQFEAITQALSGVENQADKVRLAMKLFDSGGVSLLQTMTKGSSGLKEMRQEADDLGVTLSRDTADAAARANNAMTKLNASSKGLGIALVNNLSGPITDLIAFLAKGLPRALDLVHDYFNTSNSEALSAATKSLKSYREEWERMSVLFATNPQNPILQGEAQRGMDAAMEKIVKYRQEVERLMGVINNKEEPKKDPVITITPGGGDDGNNDAAQKAIESLTLQMQTEEEKIFESYANRHFILEDARAADLITDKQYYDLLGRVEEDHAKNKLKLEVDVQNQINSMKQNAVQLGLGLLNELGKGHKDWARASIVIEKGLNIAMAIQNTAVAVTKALAVDPTGVLAARAQTIGSIQVGLIAATGIAQLSNVSGGGTSPISSGTTAPYTDTSYTSETTAASTKSQINIYIEGSAIGNDEVRRVITEAIETAQSNDEIYIRS